MSEAASEMSEAASETSSGVESISSTEEIEPMKTSEGGEDGESGVVVSDCPWIVVDMPPPSEEKGPTDGEDGESLVGDCTSIVDVPVPPPRRRRPTSPSLTPSIRSLKRPPVPPRPTWLTLKRPPMEENAPTDGASKTSYDGNKGGGVMIIEIEEENETKSSDRSAETTGGGAGQTSSWQNRFRQILLSFFSFLSFWKTNENDQGQERRPTDVSSKMSRRWQIRRRRITHNSIMFAVRKKGLKRSFVDWLKKRTNWLKDGLVGSFRWLKTRLPLSVLKSSFFYASDVYTDLALSIEYFVQGHNWWGASTLVFFLIPFIVFAIFGLCRFCWETLERKMYRRERDKKLVAVSVFFGYPNALLMEAANEEANAEKLKKEGKVDDVRTADYNVQELRKKALGFRLFEILIESLPQFCLQLYVFGNLNQISTSPLKILSMATSLWSITIGTINPILAREDMERYRATFKRKALFIIIFVVWLALHVVIFVPSLAFFSSLKNHSHPAYTLLLIYYFIHVPLSTTASFLTTDKFCRLFSIFLQLSFCSLSLFFASSWFISVAPFIDDSTFISHVTDIIWPEPPSILRGWVGPNISDPFINATDYPWAECEHSSGNSTSCLTEFAAPIYSGIFYLSFILLAFQFVLAVAWPSILEKVFYRMDDIFYWKESIDEADKYLPADDDFQFQSLKLIRIVKSLKVGVTPELKRDLMEQFEHMDEFHFSVENPNVEKPASPTKEEEEEKKKTKELERKVWKMATLSHLEKSVKKLIEVEAKTRTKAKDEANPEAKAEANCEAKAEAKDEASPEGEAEAKDEERELKNVLQRVVEVRFRVFTAYFRQWERGTAERDAKILEDFVESVERWSGRREESSFEESVKRWKKMEDEGIVATNEFLSESRLRELKSALIVVAKSERISVEPKKWEKIEEYLRGWFEKAKSIDDRNFVKDEIRENLREEILTLVHGIATINPFADRLSEGLDWDKGSNIDRLAHGLEEMPFEKPEKVLTKNNHNHCERMKSELENISRRKDDGNFYEKYANAGHLLRLKTVLEEKFVSTLTQRQQQQQRQKQQQQQQQRETSEDEDFSLDRKLQIFREMVDVLDSMITIGGLTKATDDCLKELSDRVPSLARILEQMPMEKAKGVLTKERCERMKSEMENMKFFEWIRNRVKGDDLRRLKTAISSLMRQQQQHQQQQRQDDETTANEDSSLDEKIRTIEEIVAIIDAFIPTRKINYELDLIWWKVPALADSLADSRADSLADSLERTSTEAAKLVLTKKLCEKTKVKLAELSKDVKGDEYYESDDGVIKDTWYVRNAVKGNDLRKLKTAISNLMVQEEQREQQQEQQQEQQKEQQGQREQQQQQQQQPRRDETTEGKDLSPDEKGRMCDDMVRIIDRFVSNGLERVAVDFVVVESGREDDRSERQSPSPPPTSPPSSASEAAPPAPRRITFERKALCPEGHALSLWIGGGTWYCDGKKSETGCIGGITDGGEWVGVPRYECRRCNFDLCDKCYSKARDSSGIEVHRKLFVREMHRRLGYY